MTSEMAANVAQVVGAIISAIAVLVAASTYLSSYLQRKAEQLWELLYDCEQDFNQVYRDFDQAGMVETVGRVLSQKKMDKVYQAVWEKRFENEEDIKALIEMFEMEIKFAIHTTLSSSNDGRLSLCNEKFEIALFKIRPRYPVLHTFLSSYHKLMGYSSRITQDSEKFYKLIKEGLIRMKQVGDLEQQASASNVHSFLYAVSISIFQAIVKEEKLNELYSILKELLQIVLETYRHASPIKLWRISHAERRIKTDLYRKDKFSMVLEAVVEVKKKELAKEYGRASNYVGQATVILT